MPSTIINNEIEASRMQLRGALRTTRWLRRIAVFLVLVLIVLMLAIKVQG